MTNFAKKDVGRAFNTVTIQFYRRHGYCVEGPADILFGEVRHFRMRKDLSP